ncbi:STAS domain-containing protein [Nocardia sp. NPDC057227]|uniref:STAS domain-containing protein n=1 Tax=Nocardia sp. NPDC057227 TaxID=3346056 RepID=UPI00362686A6
MSAHLTVRTRTDAEGPVVELAGELDFAGAPQVLALLSGLSLSAGEMLVLDLRALTFCDSRGITVLIAAHHRAQGAGATLTLVAVPADIGRTLRLLGVDQLFGTADTVAAARAPRG